MSTEAATNNTFVRATGLLVIEVRNANPNGDPDRESDPRQRYDERGEISPVSFKRKVRDLIEGKCGPVWDHVAKQFDLDPEKFAILESGQRGFDKAVDAADAWRKVLEIVDDPQAMKDKYWDARVFGCTFLEKGEDSPEEDEATKDAPKGKKGKKDRKYIKTGVAQFGLALSVAPVTIQRRTLTKKASAEEGKDRGMAPLGLRFVEHGVYVMPFFINPTAATGSGCTKLDIDVLLAVIPHAYAHTMSVPRAGVEIRHAWYLEHKSDLGSCSDFALIDALTPKRKDDSEKPSKSWDDYSVPPALPKELLAKLKSCRDLMEAQ
jgi:CRISPR/Cas system type I-B associated protein Csh2 (Cas7 group RAMP superfamily)